MDKIVDGFSEEFLSVVKIFTLVVAVLFGLACEARIELWKAIRVFLGLRGKKNNKFSQALGQEYLLNTVKYGAVLLLGCITLIITLASPLLKTGPGYGLLLVLHLLQVIGLTLLFVQAFRGVYNPKSGYLTTAVFCSGLAGLIITIAMLFRRVVFLKDYWLSDSGLAFGIGSSVCFLLYYIGLFQFLRGGIQIKAGRSLTLISNLLFAVLLGCLFFMPVRIRPGNNPTMIEERFKDDKKIMEVFRDLRSKK